MGKYGVGQTVSSIVNAITQGVNNNQNREHDKEMLELTNRGNEQARIHQDRINRKLYTDLQSPAAMRKQYEEAGLNPALALGIGAGGTIGTGSASGGTGNSTAGIAPQFSIDIEGRIKELELMQAQIDKTKAETSNVNTNTEKQKAETETEKTKPNLNEAYKKLANSQTNKTNAETSIAEWNDAYNRTMQQIKEATDIATLGEINARIYKTEEEAKNKSIINEKQKNIIDADIEKAKAETRKAISEAILNEMREKYNIPEKEAKRIEEMTNKLIAEAETIVKSTNSRVELNEKLSKYYEKQEKLAGWNTAANMIGGAGNLIGNIVKAYNPIASIVR